MNYKLILPSFIVVIVTLSLSGIALTAFAQQATSLCAVTVVGSPSPSISLPPECGPNVSGDYHNPLALPDQMDKLDTIITAINTEMGSYAGSGQFGGHVEHAGLDIMTIFGNKGPVYAVTDGKVESIMSGDGPVEISACSGIRAGCTLRLVHDNDPYTSAYVHIDPDSTSTVGKTLKKGEKIGVVHNWVGEPGMDHLHLEFRLTENNYNINPRLYFPELEQFPIAPGYNGDVRSHSAGRGILLEEGSGPWAEKFKNHPPCPRKDYNADGVTNETDDLYCWAK